MLKSEEIVNCWFLNYGQYSSFGCVQSVVPRIPYFSSQSGKAVIFLPDFSFPPETAGRQEVTKERSSGPPGLGPRSPPDSRNSRSGAARHGGLRTSGAAERSLARPLARPRARPRHRPAPAGPAPPRPRSAGQTRAWGARRAGGRLDGTGCCVQTVPLPAKSPADQGGNVDGLSGEDPSCMPPGADCTGSGTRLEEARSHGWKLWHDG